MLDAAPDETLLEVNNIEVIYNHVILVLKGVSLSVRRGGITALPDNAPFPLYRDVDVVVVVDRDASEEEIELSYRGLMLEIITQSLDSHNDVEAILANPSRGPNLAATRIFFHAARFFGGKAFLVFGLASTGQSQGLATGLCLGGAQPERSARLSRRRPALCGALTLRSA